jgi:HKD family nuclease
MEIKKVKFRTVSKANNFNPIILYNHLNKFKKIKMIIFYLNHHKFNKFSNYLAQPLKMSISLVIYSNNLIFQVFKLK